MRWFILEIRSEIQDSTWCCPYLETAEAMCGQTRSGFPTKSDPVSWVSVVFYYEFSRQRAGLMIYFFPSEITNAEHLPSGHLIEPTAA